MRMDGVVLTSTPVAVPSPKPEHPVVAHRFKLQGFGIAGIVAGLYAIGLGAYYVGISRTLEYEYRSSYALDVNMYLKYAIAFGSFHIVAGALFIIAGSLAITVYVSPTKCHIVTGNVISILACIAAFGLFGFQCLIVYATLLTAQVNVLLLANVVMLLLAFAEIVITILHASYSCGCCGRTYAPQLHTAMTITTHGSGYAPLENEQFSHVTSKQPQMIANGPPVYA